MKSTLETKNSVVAEYPKPLMSNDKDIVVLFSEPGKGMVIWVSEGSKYKMGEYSDSWSMVCFKEDFNYRVIIE